MKLVDFCWKYVDELQSGARCRYHRAVSVAEGTMISFKTLAGAVERFENETNESYELDEVGMEFQRRFVEWCRLKRKISGGTIHRYMTLMRTVMNVAVREKLCSNLEFRRAEFVPLSEMNDALVLNQDKMEHLMSFRFKDRRLREARDIFVVGYLTGQRFSDYSRLCKEMYAEFDGQKFVRITQQKTGTIVYVPLDVRVEKIIKRYGGRLPALKLSDFNMRLGEVALSMGWNGELKLTSHTARRSFATNAYAAGVPIASIMCVTGHTREEHLRRYLRLSTATLAVQAAHDFEKFSIAK
ncbi:MAG: site-specific integrase [Paludibacteraceae bacterium]|nr:site-specific integrase [Paludibacteraceae bacterium]